MTHPSDPLHLEDPEDRKDLSDLLRQWNLEYSQVDLSDLLVL
jgi:hypothetical protein